MHLVTRPLLLVSVQIGPVREIDREIDRGTRNRLADTDARKCFLASLGGGDAKP